MFPPFLFRGIFLNCRHYLEHSFHGDLGYLFFLYEALRMKKTAHNAPRGDSPRRSAIGFLCSVGDVAKCSEY